MQRQTYNISFACCEHKKSKKTGLSPLKAIIIINGERTTFNLLRKERPEDFKKAMASNKTNDIRNYCYAIEKQLDECANRMVMAGMPLTARALKAEYLFNGSSYSLTRLNADYLEEIKHRKMHQSVKRKYELGMASFIEVVGNKEIHQVNMADCKKWLAAMQAKYEQSTVYGYFTKVKSFFIYACDCNIIQKNPFGSLKTSRGFKPKDVLSANDYLRIKNSHYYYPRLERAKDIFIFACGSGLGWTDMRKLKPTDFTQIDGKWCIVKPRQKTGIQYVSVLLPDAVEVAKKYNFDFATVLISNQKINQNLKDIQCHCNVKSVDSLSFYCARHYYIQTLTLAGVSAAAIMKSAGHTNFKQTYEYTNLSKTDVVKEISRHINFEVKEQTPTQTLNHFAKSSTYSSTDGIFDFE